MKIHWTEPGYSTERVRAWRKLNAARQKASSRKYYMKNKKRISKYSKTKYKKDPVAVITKVKAYRTKNPDQVRNAAYKRNYGLTLVQYEKMLLAQGGVCVLCGNPPKKTRLAVDHCHRDKRVRGLACFRCNKFLIGRWKSEHAPLLRRAADYLESTFDGRTL